MDLKMILSIRVWVTQAEIAAVLPEAAVNAKDFACDERCYWHSIEDVDKYFPHLHVAPSLAFVIEAVDCCLRVNIGNTGEKTSARAYV